jgi:hypothetical protein
MGEDSFLPVFKMAMCIKKEYENRLRSLEIYPGIFYCSLSQFIVVYHRGIKDVRIWRVE